MIAVERSFDMKTRRIKLNESSFLKGIASILNLRGYQMNIDINNPRQADLNALQSDWCAVLADLGEAEKQYRRLTKRK